MFRVYQCKISTYKPREYVAEDVHYSDTVWLLQRWSINASGMLVSLNDNVPGFILSKTPDTVETVTLEHVDTLEDDGSEELEHWITKIHDISVKLLGVENELHQEQSQHEQRRKASDLKWKVYVLPRMIGTQNENGDHDAHNGGDEKAGESVRDTIAQWQQCLEPRNGTTLLEHMEDIVRKIDPSWDLSRAISILREAVESCDIVSVLDDRLKSDKELCNALEVVDKLDIVISNRYAVIARHSDDDGDGDSDKEKLFIVYQVDPFKVVDCSADTSNHSTHSQPLLRVASPAIAKQQKNQRLRKKGISPLLLDMRQRVEMMKHSPADNDIGNSATARYLLPTQCISIDTEKFHLDSSHAKPLRKILLHVNEALCHYRELHRFQARHDMNMDQKLLLRRAFTHPAFAQEREYPPKSYQQLEFIGDAVVHFAAMQFVYRAFTEEYLFETNWHEVAIRLISNNFLRRVESRVNLVDLVLYSQPRETLKMQKKLVADVWESLLGALVTDQGFEAALQFHRRICLDGSLINLLPKIKKQVRPIGSHFTRGSKPDVSTEFMNHLSQLESKIGVRFGDEKSLLMQAMCHWSWSPSSARKIDEKELVKLRRLGILEHDKYDDEREEIAYVGDYYCFNNESLKFIGVALLKPIVAEHLYFTFPGATEEQLTLSIHAIMDKHDLCMQHAFEQLELEKYVYPQNLLDGKTEMQRRRLLADMFHALIGAVFVHSGQVLHKFTKEQPTFSPSNGPLSGDEDDFFAQTNGIYHDVAGSIVHRFLLSKFAQMPTLYPFNIEKPKKNRLINLVQRQFGAPPKFDFEKSETDNGIMYRVIIRAPMIKQGERDKLAVISEAEAPTHRQAEGKAIDAALAQSEKPHNPPTAMDVDDDSGDKQEEDNAIESVGWFSSCAIV